jgi:hypothetical protein
MVPNQIQLSLKMKFFESDRLQPEYADVPGQWGTIWLTNGSTNNTINHLTIKMPLSVY